MKKKSAVLYLCVILAGIVSGLCVPSSWYSSAERATVARLGR